MSDLVKLKNVSFQYENSENEIINGISTTIGENQLIAVLGPNGSGKSTLARLLDGLLLPSDGMVLVDNIDTSSAGDLIWDIRRGIGMVFQNPDNQIVANTVEDDVAFGLENQGLEPHLIRKRVDDTLKKVGLSDLKLNDPNHLSGGQKQKVAIAGILAMQPRVIIFDEATSMLDPNGKNEVLSAARKIVEAEKITTILITHFLDEALLADRVIIMEKGQIILDGTPEKIFQERDKLKKIGLEVPLITEIAFRLKEKGYPFRTNIIGEEEFLKELWKLT